MPSLKVVRENGRSIVCRNNLRQLAVALNLYTMSHKDKALVSEGGDEFWFTQIAPYMGAAEEYKEDPQKFLEGAMKVMFCPSTREPINPYEPGNFWSPGTSENRWRYHVIPVEGSYTMNSWVGGWEMEAYARGGEIRNDEVGYAYRNKMSGKGNIPAFADGIWVDSVPLDRNVVPIDAATLLDPREPTGSYADAGLARYCIDRHRMKVNVAYIDGRAVPVTLETLWKLPWNMSFTARDVTMP